MVNVVVATKGKKPRKGLFAICRIIDDAECEREKAIALLEFVHPKTWRKKFEVRLEDT